MFGLNILDSKDTAFYRIKLHIIQITLKTNSLLQVVWCLQEAMISFNCRYQSISQAAHNLAVKSKRQLEHRCPRGNLQKPNENTWQYLPVQLILHHPIHSNVRDISGCFVACWADESCWNEKPTTALILLLLCCEGFKIEALEASFR